MRILGAMLLVAITMPAQVFVVDPVGGPGTHFTSIAAAVAAVPDGAVVQVNPGVYSGFTIQNKGLTVIATPPTLVSDLLQPPIRIDNIPAGKTVTLSGLGIHNQLGVGSIWCTNSAGTIVLEGCRGDQSTAPAGGRVLASNCAQLHLRHCFFTAMSIGASPLDVTASNAVVFGSSLSAPFAPAVRMQGGQVDVVASTLASWFLAPTVLLQGGTLRLRGYAVYGSGPGGLLIDGAGTVRLDPATSLLNGASPPFGAGVLVLMVAQPQQSATSAPPGGTASATLQAMAGHPSALYVGFAGAPYLPVGVADPVWLLPGSEILQAVGSSPLSASYAVPNAPWVVGITVCWQGVVLSPFTGLRLSNPAVYTHY